MAGCSCFLKASSLCGCCFNPVGRAWEEAFFFFFFSFFFFDSAALFHPFSFFFYFHSLFSPSLPQITALVCAVILLIQIKRVNQEVSEYYSAVYWGVHLLLESGGSFPSVCVSTTDHSEFRWRLLLCFFYLMNYFTLSPALKSNLQSDNFLRRKSTHYCSSLWNGCCLL